MKIIMKNGIVIEDVSVSEAIQILGKTPKEEKIKIEEKIKNRPYRFKAGTKRNKVWWTEDEIKYILENSNMKPKQLHETITRHTILAIGIMRSAIKTGKYHSAGKYVQKIVNAFYNKGVTPRVGNKQVDSISDRT